MALPYLKSLAVGDKVTDVHSVTVQVSRCPEELSVIVDAACSREYLLLTVIVTVGCHYIMVAAAPAGSGLVVSGIEYPPFHQFLVPDVYCGPCKSGIVSSAVYGRGVDSVKIGDTAVHAVNAVAVVVAPVAHLASGYGKIYGIQRCACLSVKESHILWTAEDISLSVAVILAAVAYDLSPAVGGPVSGLCDELSLSVAVKVRNAHLCIVLTRSDILSQVYAPELFSLKCVAVNENIVGLSLLRIVLGVGRVPFQEYLILSVAVHISHNAVIGRILASGAVKLYVEVVGARVEPALLRGGHLSALHTVNAVL